MTRTPREPAMQHGEDAPNASRATAEGTARYGASFAPSFDASFFRPFPKDLRVSSIGLGTYLGECTRDDDDGYAGTTRVAIASGINLIDTAINYRCQRSERSVGNALATVLADGAVARSQIVVCTKGGYIPLDGNPPKTRDDYLAYVQREYFDTGVARPEDVVAGGHCIAPSFLRDQLDRSRANLGLDAIDVYYVHNPEQQLDAVAPDELAQRLRAAFAMLEERCAEGQVGIYGCATWNGLRVPPGTRGHVSLEALVAAARDVGGASHHFAAVQLPLNLASAEAVREPTQQLGRHTVPLVQAAAELGVAVVASASLMQGKLARDLPASVGDALPGLTTDAQRAIAFVRSLPWVASALVGTRSPDHLTENLGAARRR